MSPPIDWIVTSLALDDILEKRFQLPLDHPIWREAQDLQGRWEQNWERRQTDTFLTDFDSDVQVLRGRLYQTLE